MNVCVYGGVCVLYLSGYMQTFSLVDTNHKWKTTRHSSSKNSRFKIVSLNVLVTDKSKSGREADIESKRETR